MSNLILRELPADQRSDAETVWRELESRFGNGGLTSSWFWNSSWLDVYGDLVPHVFLIAERDGAPCAITLITQGVSQKRGPVPVRSIHLGTGGEPLGSSVCTEYLRLLVNETDRQEVSLAILKHVTLSVRKWEEFVLDGMVPGDAQPFLQHKGYWFVRNETCRVSDFRPIRKAGSDVIASLGKNTRYSIRRSMRRFGDLTVESAATEEQAHSFFEEMVDLHQRHWTAIGEPGAFADSRFSAFHRLILKGLLERNALLMMRVRTADETIGSIYGFIENNRVLMYQSGFADFEDDKLKPGLVSHALIMQYCLDTGIDEYDYLYGDSRYKQDLTNSSRELIYAVLCKRTIKQVLLRRARVRHYGESMKLSESEISTS